MMLRPFASKRPTISPTSRRWTPSGFTKTRVRSTAATRASQTVSRNPLPARHCIGKLDDVKRGAPDQDVEARAEVVPGDDRDGRRVERRGDRYREPPPGPR